MNLQNLNYGILVINIFMWNYVKLLRNKDIKMIVKKLKLMNIFNIFANKEPLKYLNNLSLILFELVSFFLTFFTFTISLVSILALFLPFPFFRWRALALSAMKR